jgi:hypothetical protein
VIRKIVPFKRWHYTWLGPAAEGAEAIPVSAETLALLEGARSWTAMVDGEVIGCGGTIQQWPGRHTAWAYFSYLSGPHMGWATRAVRRGLAEVQGRIEFTVRADFEAGHRWARLLGFAVETPRLVAFGPTGEDHVGYTRHN